MPKSKKINGDVHYQSENTYVYFLNFGSISLHMPQKWYMCPKIVCTQFLSILDHRLGKMHVGMPFSTTLMFNNLLKQFQLHMYYSFHTSYNIHSELKNREILWIFKSKLLPDPLPNIARFQHCESNIVQEIHGQNFYGEYSVNYHAR